MLLKASLMALSRIGDILRDFNDVLRDFVDVLHDLRITCGVLLVRHYSSYLV